MRKRDRRVGSASAPVMMAGAAVLLCGGIFFFSSAAPAHAYSVEGSAGNSGVTAGSINGTDLNLNFSNLLAPLQNFFQSINSVGNTNLSPWAPGAPPSGGGISAPFSPAGSSWWSAAVQGAIQQFDSWLYGIAGFHIVNLLNAALSILSWILGVVKGAVDWLLTVL